MRAERILSRWGSEIFFNLGEDLKFRFWTNFFQILLLFSIKFPNLGEDRSSDSHQFRPHCTFYKFLFYHVWIFFKWCFKMSIFSLSQFWFGEHFTLNFFQKETSKSREFEVPYQRKFSYFYFVYHGFVSILAGPEITSSKHIVRQLAE